MRILTELRWLKRRFHVRRVLRRPISCPTVCPRHPVGHGHRSFGKVFKLHAPYSGRPLLRTLGSVWQEHYSDLFEPGLRVMVKINLNSSNPYPASTSPEMLEALLETLQYQGITDIVVGACSANVALPTRRQAKKTGILDVITGGARLLCFDEEPWVRVPVSGDYLKQVTVPQESMRVDRIISLANLKTHKLADFTFGMKLAVGFMHPQERILLHRDHLQQKVVELQLAVPSDLTIIDGRLAFITGGPDEGEVRPAHLMILGSNPLAVDIEAYKALYVLKKKHACIEGFAQDPLDMAQFKHAVKLGVGTGLNGTYRPMEVIDGRVLTGENPAHLSAD